MTKTERLIKLFGKQIAQGEYGPGALPSEAELCERFDASRNVMREVVKVLATKRLIDAQPHRGLFVMPREKWNFLDVDVLAWALEKGDDPQLINSLIEVRSLIEPSISRWAAERATAVDLVAIEASFNEMEANVNNREVFHEADIRFHKAILLATHNVVIQQLSDAISALQRAIFDHTFLAEKRHMEQTMREHADLFDAIRRKNPDAAELACHDMVQHTAGRAKAKPEGTASQSLGASSSPEKKTAPASGKQQSTVLG